MTFFLIIEYKFCISPIFSLLQYISLCFRKIIISPYFCKFPPDFVKFTCYLHTFCVFRFPLYFHHDAFMHHTMHVLDAPGRERYHSTTAPPQSLRVSVLE